MTGHQLTDPFAAAVMRSGVPVIDAATTWCHLASVLTHDDLVAAADHLVLTPARQRSGDRRPYVTAEQLRARVDSYHGPGARAALPEPELNLDVYDDEGRWIGRFDQVRPRWKVIVEYDGEQHRLDDRQYDRDEIKIEGAIQAGWNVVRIRKGAMFAAGATAVTRVERALRASGWQP